MSGVASLLRRLPRAGAADEFVLTTVVLFLAVTVVRWLRAPDSPIRIADLHVALAVIGSVSGAILTALILTPLGRRSGGHMNPGVTIALWLMGAFPGRRVIPYACAQIAGSAAGTGLARLVWGRAVSDPAVAGGAISPASAWQPADVFLAETGAMAALIAIVGYFLAHPRHTRLIPYVIGVSVAAVIALLGPLSGGSVNPARQFGPAVLSGQTTDLWIYLVTPALGAVVGAVIHRLSTRQFPATGHLTRDVGDAESGRQHTPAGSSRLRHGPAKVPAGPRGADMPNRSAGTTAAASPSGSHSGRPSSSIAARAGAPGPSLPVRPAPHIPRSGPYQGSGRSPAVIGRCSSFTGPG